MGLIWSTDDEIDHRFELGPDSKQLMSLQGKKGSEWNSSTVPMNSEFETFQGYSLTR